MAEERRKLTIDEKRTLVKKILDSGTTIGVACQENRISYSTFMNWKTEVARDDRERAKRGDAPVPAPVKAVQAPAPVPAPNPPRPAVTLASVVSKLAGVPATPQPVPVMKVEPTPMVKVELTPVVKEAEPAPAWESVPASDSDEAIAPAVQATTKTRRPYTRRAKVIPAPVESAPVKMMTLQDAIEFVKSLSDTCVVFAAKGNATYTEFKGSPEDYTHLCQIGDLQHDRATKYSIPTKE